MIDIKFVDVKSPDAMTFVVSYIDGEASGCGVLREYSPTCGELK